jgi:hypothetical protein
MTLYLPVSPAYSEGMPDNLMVAQYLEAKTEYEKAKQRLDELSDRLIKQMEADQRKSFRWAEEGLERRLTYVQQHQTFIDEPGLRKALTAKVFDRYTKRVLDRKAMELAMDAGTVDPITVSRFVTTRPKKPFLTYTEKETA